MTLITSSEDFEAGAVGAFVTRDNSMMDPAPIYDGGGTMIHEGSAVFVSSPAIGSLAVGAYAGAALDAGQLRFVRMIPEVVGTPPTLAQSLAYYQSLGSFIGMTLPEFEELIIGYYGSVEAFLALPDAGPTVGGSPEREAEHYASSWRNWIAAGAGGTLGSAQFLWNAILYGPTNTQEWYLSLNVLVDENRDHRVQWLLSRPDGSSSIFVQTKVADADALLDTWLAMSVAVVGDQLTLAVTGFAATQAPDAFLGGGSAPEDFTASGPLQVTLTVPVGSHMLIEDWTVDHDEFQGEFRTFLDNVSVTHEDPDPAAPTAAPRRVVTSHSTRLFPRDDGAGMSSAPRLYPPPRAGRVFGGHQ